MSHPEILEGTWEELAARAEEFRGRRLRLIVLPIEPKVTETVANEIGLQEAAKRLFTEADNIEREPGRPSSDPYTRAFGEIIAEKYRKMGLKL